MVLLGWCVTQIGFSALNAALAALLIDHVPDAQRGKVSGLIGMCQALGVVIGVFLVQTVRSSVALMFVVPGAVAAAAVLVLVVMLHDRRLAREARGRYDLREFARSFWVNPIRHPGVRWASRRRHGTSHVVLLPAMRLRILQVAGWRCTRFPVQGRARYAP